FMGHNYKPRKSWWEFTMDKSEWSGWMRQLAEQPEKVSAEFAALRFGEKELHKHAVIEKIPFDLEAYLETGNVNKEAGTLLVVLYALDGESRKPKPRPFFMRLNA